MLPFTQEHYIYTVRIVNIVPYYLLTYWKLVLRRSRRSYCVLASISCLFILSGGKTICSWVTFDQAMAVVEWHQNPLATSYLFLVYYGFWPGEISHVCSYFITVIADGLMASLFLSYSISNWLMSLRYGGATKCGGTRGASFLCRFSLSWPRLVCAHSSLWCIWAHTWQPCISQAPS